MFGFSSHRRSSQPARVARRAAAWEPLESRQLLSGTLLPAVDAGLTVVYRKSTLPISLLSGTNLKGAVTVQITNSEATNDTGSNTFAVYASTDAVLDSTDVRLGYVTRNLNLKTGKTLVVTVPVKSQPFPIAGSYDILIAATDASGVVTTSEATPAPSLTVAAAFVDLTATVGAATPTALVPGKTITFRTTITNGGNVNSTGTLITAIGLSTDGVTAPTVELISKQRNATIKGGDKALSLTFKVKVPVGTAAGTYYPAVTINQGTAAQFTAFSTTPITVGMA